MKLLSIDEINDLARRAKHGSAWAEMTLESYARRVIRETNRRLDLIDESGLHSYARGRLDNYIEEQWGLNRIPNINSFTYDLLDIKAVALEGSSFLRMKTSTVEGIIDISEQRVRSLNERINANEIDRIIRANNGYLGQSEAQRIQRVNNRINVLADNSDFWEILRSDSFHTLMKTYPSSGQVIDDIYQLWSSGLTSDEIVEQLEKVISNEPEYSDYMYDEAIDYMETMAIFR